MKRILVILALLLSIPTACHAATRTISTAGGLWNATTTWAEGAVPVAGDDVVATATSGNLTVNVATAALNSFDLTGYAGTMQSTFSITVQPAAGTVNCKFAGTITWTGTLLLNPQGTAIINLTTNGAHIQAITEAATAGTGVVSIQDPLYVNALLTVTRGTLTTNNNSVSVNGFSSSNANARTLNLGTSTVTLRAATGNIWLCTTTTNMTLSAAAASIVAQGGAGVSPVIDMGNTALTYGSIQVNSGNVTLAGSSGMITINNFTLSNGVGGDVTVSMQDLNTIINNFTAGAGCSTKNRCRIVCAFSNSPTRATITCNGTWNLQYVDFRGIAGAGTAARNFSAITGNCGDEGYNTGITFTTAAPQYWVGNAGSWSDVSHWASTPGGTGGTGRVPLAQDTATFESHSFTVISRVVTEDCLIMGGNIDWSLSTNSPRFTLGTSCYIFGNANMTGLSMFTPGTNSMVFMPATNATFTSAGTQPYLMDVRAPYGTFYLGDDILGTGVGGITIESGGFNTNSHAISAKTMKYTTISTCTITLGTSVITLSGTGTVWDMDYTGTTPTFSGANSTISISDASATIKTFSGSVQTGIDDTKYL